MAIQKADCLMELRETMDQQLIRIFDCDATGSGRVPTAPVLYELPQNTVPVVAPVDAGQIEPGVSVTDQPAPYAGESVTKTAVSVTDEPAAKQSNKTFLLIGGALLLLLLSRKKK